MATNADKPAEGPKRVRRSARSKSTSTVSVARVDEARETEASSWPRGGFLRRGSVRHHDITVLLRQLIMLLEAGTPLLKALHTLAARGHNAGIRALATDISNYVESGNPLWLAFDRHPRYFAPVFVNLVKASEASGTLTTVLRRLVEYREERELLRKRVQGAMLYPVILVVASFAVVLLISKWVIPQFEQLFNQLNVPLPRFSRAFIAVANFLGWWWWLFALLIIGLIVLYKLWYVRSPLRRLTADRIKLKLPVIGDLVRKNAMVEFTRTLALLLRSGLSMMASLELVRNAVHNQAMVRAIQDMRDSVERGEGLEAPLRQHEEIIPPVAADMLLTGEEAGSMDEIADEIGTTYEKEVNIQVDTLGDALQPILTVFIGIIVILLALALFVPMVGMIEQITASAGA
jgi:type II secretory pathway component PulF